MKDMIHTYKNNSEEVWNKQLDLEQERDSLKQELVLQTILHEETKRQLQLHDTGSENQDDALDTLWETEGLSELLANQQGEELEQRLKKILKDSLRNKKASEIKVDILTELQLNIKEVQEKNYKLESELELLKMPKSSRKASANEGFDSRCKTQIDYFNRILSRKSSQLKVFVQDGVDEPRLKEWRKQVHKMIQDWESFGKLVTENSCPSALLEDLESLDKIFGDFQAQHTKALNVLVVYTIPDARVWQNTLTEDQMTNLEDELTNSKKVLKELEKNLDLVNPENNTETKNLVFAKREAWRRFKKKIAMFNHDFLDMESVDQTFESLCNALNKVENINETQRTEFAKFWTSNVEFGVFCLVSLLVFISVLIAFGERVSEVVGGDLKEISSV